MFDGPLSCFLDSIFLEQIQFHSVYRSMFGLVGFRAREDIVIWTILVLYMYVRNEKDP